MTKDFENKYFAYHKHTTGAWMLWIGNFCQIGKNNKDYPSRWHYINMGEVEEGSFPHCLEMGRFFIYW